MTAACIPVSANVICRHGRDVLLMRRSSAARMWPQFWAFPGGKVDDGEFFREAAAREVREEMGILFSDADIRRDTVILCHTNQGMKLYYFCAVDEWQGMPEILEPHLATDLAWFPIDALPELMVPHHRLALEAIENGVSYQEFCPIL